MTIPSLDFETYSEAGFAQDPDDRIRGVGPQGKGGLPVVGTPQYAAHPSTEILCASYDMHDGRGVQSWVPGSPAPAALIEHVRFGGMIRAYNVTFEWYIWNMVGARRYGWPPLQIEQCICDMAAARRFSLPGSLANVAKVLGTPGKDREGGRLIQKLTRPHTPTKKRSDIRWTPATAWDDFVSLYRYCDQDVIAEDAASALIPELSDHERQVWLTDQTINARGVQVDTVTLDAALSILGQAEQRYNAELADITGGAVQAATETIKLKGWLVTQGVHMDNMQKDYIANMIDAGEFVNDPSRANALRSLRIRQILGSANIKKLRTLKLQTSSDGRLRDQYMYCGADRTGRWSAGGVQLQNLTGKGPDAYRCSECDGISGDPGKLGVCRRCGQWAGLMEPLEWGPEAAEWAIQDIRTGDLDVILAMWGDAPLDVLCGCLRALFVARDEYELIYMDFSAIEAVIAACISRCQWRIDVFNSGRDIYLESIGRMTGKQDLDASDRKRGKVAELAGAYGCWIKGWKDFGADKYYASDDELKAAILKWRDDSPEIVETWGGQYRWCGPGKWDYTPELFGLEGAAISAILSPGTCFSHIDITYAVYNDILYCRLPSGRFLHYHRPRLDTVRDKLNRGDCYQITFEGYNSNAQKGPIGWHRMETWGAKLFENACQGIGRDFQADAMIRLEANGYPIVMHTHDDTTAEVPVGQGSVEAMTAIAVERPSWASWWPINAAGWSGERYRKD